MRVWRICKRKWAATAFSGIGAAENPGRWNSEGTKAVYCAESRALAMLEMLAHVGNKRLLRHARFVAIPADVPEALIAKPGRLPRGWDTKPPEGATRRFGDGILSNPGTPVLQVPSAVVPGEFCYVLNPAHPRFGEIAIGSAVEIEFDPRVLAVEERASGANDPMLQASLMKKARTGSSKARRKGGPVRPI